MNIIKDVGIKNYKAIEETQFPCASINILVGPNNTGKSSILEAIWMAISSLNNFEDVLENKISNVIRGRGRYNIEYLIHKTKEKSSVKLELHDNNKIVLDLLYSKEGYPQEVSEPFLDFIDSSNYRDYAVRYRIGRNALDPERILMRELQKVGRLYEDEESKGSLNELLKKLSDDIDTAREKARDELILSKKLFLTSKLNERLLPIYMMMDAYRGKIPTPEGKTPPPALEIPLIVSSPKIGGDIPALYGKLINTKKLAEVLESLKKSIPYFEDIREADGNLLVLLKNIDEPLPLDSMGDGFKALLKLSFMAPLIKNGVVIFEEPEVSMHPGYLEVLAEEIISSSEYSQFFISTHSLELVEYLLKKAEKAGVIDSINIIRLHRREGGYIDREICTGRAAKEEMEEIKTDLRGF